MPARPYHIPLHARQAKPYTIPCQQGHTIYHAMPTWLCHKPFLVHEAIPYSMPARQYCILCQAPRLARQAIYLTMPARPGHTVYHWMPAMPYYIMWCPQSLTISHARPIRPCHNTMRCPGRIRPYHIPCDARKAIPYTITCSPSQTIYSTMPARPYHTIQHSMSVRPYRMRIPCLPGHTIDHAMPYHIPYDARHAITYTMPCTTGCTIYHAMPSRSYHLMSGHAIPCPPGHIIHYAMPAKPYHKPCQAIPYTMQCSPDYTI